MMYGLLRILFMVILFGTVFLLFKIHVIRRKKIKIIIIVAVTILSCISFFCPLENALITFQSLETAFDYSNSGTINAVADGEKSSLILFTQKNTASYTIIPKSNKGWKVGIPLLSMKTLQNKMYNKRFSVIILKAQNSNDYYVLITDVKSKVPATVTDSLKTKFKHTEGLNKNTITYYAYYNNLPHSYNIYACGETINIVV